MRKIAVGCCTYTVQEAFNREPAESLYKLADIGYTTVEIGSFGPLGTRALKDTLKKAGLRVDSAHVSVAHEEILPATAHSIDFANTLGIRYLVTPIPTTMDKYLDNADGYRTGAEMLNALGKRYKENGIRLLYHNHQFEFKDLGGITGHQILYEDTDPEYVGFELDVCWLSCAGIVPEEYIKKFKGRADVIHFKDKKTVPVLNVEAVGYGELDFKAILDSTIEAGARIIYVEQDGHDVRDQFEDARLSYEYIEKLLAEV